MQKNIEISKLDSIFAKFNEEFSKKDMVFDISKIIVDSFQPQIASKGENLPKLGLEECIVSFNKAIFNSLFTRPSANFIEELKTDTSNFEKLKHENLISSDFTVSSLDKILSFENTKPESSKDVQCDELKLELQLKISGVTDEQIQILKYIGSKSFFIQEISNLYAEYLKSVNNSKIRQEDFTEDLRKLKESFERFSKTFDKNNSPADAISMLFKSLNANIYLLGMPEEAKATELLLSFIELMSEIKLKTPGDAIDLASITSSFKKPEILIFGNEVKKKAFIDNFKLFNEHLIKKVPTSITEAKIVGNVLISLHALYKIGMLVSNLSLDQFTKTSTINFDLINFKKKQKVGKIISLFSKSDEVIQTELIKQNRTLSELLDDISIILDASTANYSNSTLGNAYEEVLLEKSLQIQDKLMNSTEVKTIALSIELQIFEKYVSKQMTFKLISETSKDITKAKTVVNHGKYTYERLCTFLLKDFLNQEESLTFLIIFSGKNVDLLEESNESRNSVKNSITKLKKELREGIVTINRVLESLEAIKDPENLFENSKRPSQELCALLCICY